MTNDEETRPDSGPEAFVKAFEQGAEGLHYLSAGGALADCPDCFDVSDCDGSACGSSDPGVVCYCGDEGSFSWSGCELCGSTFGGDRYDGHAFVRPDDESDPSILVHVSMCCDCLFYVANGDVPEEWTRHP